MNAIPQTIYSAFDGFPADIREAAKIPAHEMQTILKCVVQVPA